MSSFQKNKIYNQKAASSKNILLKAYVVLVVFCLFFYSCSRDKTDAPKAIKELISKINNCTCDPYIDEYLWRDKTVYIQTCGGPACNCIVSYYNKKGEEFKMDAGYTFDNFRQESRLVKHIWTCKKQ